LHSYAFHGVHGRALPTATAVKLANRDLTVIVAGGDGDGYAIGAGHFLHAVRRNPNMTYIVMDNQTYGLTKGQSSPTSMLGYLSGTSPSGNPDAPLNGLAVALAAGGTFLARGFSSEPKAMVELIKEAVRHPGFAIVEVMSPCVTFNKVNTYKWFKENVYHVGDIEGYDSSNRTQAFEVLGKPGKIPLGIFYRENRPTLEDLSLKNGAPIASLEIETIDPGLTKLQEAYA
jgi:2-oxoglutarate ferredoxin oxidoreductase subunit beta